MPTERTPVEARQADKPGVVRWVLGVSLGAVTLLLAVVYIYFWASGGA